MTIIVQRQFIRLIAGILLLLALASLAPSVVAASLPASSLSGWLTGDVVPELRELLSRHPRYRGQRIRIVAGDQNGLSEAVSTVLNSNLAGRDGIILVASVQADPQWQVAPGSVDELDCVGTADFDYVLSISTSSDEGAGDKVQLALLDTSSVATQINNWQWQGRFSSSERRQYKRPLTAANGSLSAPWGDEDVDAAALGLSRDFACALRPQIANRLGLQWIQADGLPALFADTANTTRHKLGDYRELGISEVQPDYAVGVRIERFRDDVWQLWLTGTPQDKALAPVQAVTYFKSASLLAASRLTNLDSEAVPQAAVVNNAGPALKFIEVKMVDATQADKWRSRADLQVTLRISNRAPQPIAYSFTMSGGHFEQCIAQPRYYRHDDYGQLSGRLEAGASVMRRLVVENAQHRPRPLYGMPKCAGFRDLQGFEEFASQGYKVTDYVRWDM